jgi:hypothetical protein
MKNRTDLYWCSYYGSFARFLILTDDYESLQAPLETLRDSLGLIDTGEEKNNTLVGDLGHSRFLAPNSGSNDQKRAMLVLRYLHSISELLVDNVRKDPSGYWLLEQSQNAENPHQNNFESLAHLLANMTQFQFDVSVTFRTVWMHSPISGSATMHL